MEKRRKVSAEGLPTFRPFPQQLHQGGTLYIYSHALQKPGQSVCAFGVTSWGFMAKKIIALLKENGGSYDIIAVK